MKRRWGDKGHCLGCFHGDKAAKKQEVIADRNLVAYIGTMTQKAVDMRTAAEAEGVSERQQCAYGLVMVRDGTVEFVHERYRRYNQ